MSCVMSLGEYVVCLLTCLLGGLYTHSADLVAQSLNRMIIIIIIIIQPYEDVCFLPHMVIH